MTAPDDTQPRPGPHAVEVRGLTKAYDGRTVVDDVSFTVEEGEIFAILGPNGAGNTRRWIVTGSVPLPPTALRWHAKKPSPCPRETQAR